MIPGKSVLSLMFTSEFLLQKQKPQSNKKQTARDRKPVNERQTSPFATPGTTHTVTSLSRNRKEHETHHATEELFSDSTQHEIPTSPQESHGVAQAHNFARGSKMPVIAKDMQHQSRPKRSAMLHDLQPFEHSTSAYATCTSHKGGNDSKCTASDQTPSTSNAHQVTNMITCCPL
jgi:hypothetical protein